MREAIDMGLYEKYLDEYICLIDKTLSKFPDTTLKSFLLTFRGKLMEQKVIINAKNERNNGTDGNRIN